MRSLFLFMLWLMSESVLGKPQAVDLFCDAFPSSPSCSGAAISCNYCHAAVPPALNPFGGSVKAGIQQTGTEFPPSADAMRIAIEAFGQDDSDRDGFANLVEIQAGHKPGDDTSHPTQNGCKPGAKLVNGQWNLCQRDPAYVYKKIWLDVCGENPDYDDYKKFVGLSADRQGKALDELLDDCMESVHWR